MHELSSCFVLGYHGCGRAVAEKLLLRHEGFRKSENDYDWLGHGIYFWLENPRRACQWAHSHGIEKPAVIGAVINLGRCLDLTTKAGIDSVRTGYLELVRALRESDQPIPENSGDDDMLIRRLDCAVINMTCRIMEEDGRPVDTVKGVFTEGGPAFDGGAIMEHTHTQVAVRNPACIRGIFLPPAGELEGDDCNAGAQA